MLKRKFSLPPGSSEALGVEDTYYVGYIWSIDVEDTKRNASCAVWAVDHNSYAIVVASAQSNSRTEHCESY